VLRGVSPTPDISSSTKPQTPAKGFLICTLSSAKAAIHEYYQR
jgi:hypothetical protein